MNAQTHCLFCSLVCPLRLESERGEHFSVDHEMGEPGHSHGLCGRGTGLVELVQHPHRFAGALERQDGRARPLHLEEAGEAFARLVDRALAAGPAALIADGNLPCEDLVAIARWAQSKGRQAEMAVHLPPVDLDALDGLSATGAPVLGPAALATCDGVVVIGDAFATHPVLGRALLDWKYAHPRALFAVVDTHLSVSSRFGTKLKVPPGKHQEVLQLLLQVLEMALLLEPSPLLQKVARYAGIEEYGGVLSFARRLQAAQKLAVVMAPELTKNADWLGVAALAGQLARQKGGGVLPLYTCGNAVGAYRVMRNLGLRPFAALLRENSSWAAIVEVGCDPQQTYPEELLQPLYGRAPRRVVLASMRTGQVEAADLAVALWLPVEGEGTVVDGFGEEKRLLASVRPAWGTTGAGAFFGALLKQQPVGEKAVWKEIPPPKPGWAPVRQEVAGNDEVQLLATASAIHFDDGALTRQTGWTEYWQAAPVAALAPETAARLGVGRGGKVALQHNGRSLCLACRVETSLDPSLVLVPVHFPQVRRFLPWRLEGERLCCPAPVVQVKATPE